MKWKFLLIVAVAIVLAIVGIRFATNAGSQDLAAAISMAQRSLPKFRERVNTPGPTDKAFFVRASFGKPDRPDILWVRDVKTTPDGFRGILDQSPSITTDIGKGEKVEIKSQSVVDWTILHTDKTVEGGFTQGLEPSK